MATELLD